MGQVTIYLDSKTETKLLNIVKKSGISKSKWIADLIKEKTSRRWQEPGRICPLPRKFGPVRVMMRKESRCEVLFGHQYLDLFL